jgi:hypothetical protein
MAWRNWKQNTDAAPVKASLLIEHYAIYRVTGAISRKGPSREFREVTGG